MNMFKKALLTTAFLGATGVANAGLPFTIDPSVTTGPAPSLGTAPFEADTAGARYLEDVTFFNDGTFDANILVNLRSFSLDSTGIAPTTTGLDINYGVYATIDVTGNFSGSGTSIVLNGFSGALSLWLDNGNDSVFQSGTSVNGGTSATVVNANTADSLLGTSSEITGAGIGNAQAGGFTFVFADLMLTSGTAEIDGDEFFVAPNPFHTVGISTGDLGDAGSSLQNVDLSDLFNGTATSIRGVAAGDTSVEFIKVSAPTALSIMGLGLVLMGFNARRNK